MIRDISREHVLIIVASLLVGLAIGLFLAWQVWPVRWIDTDPSDLRIEHQHDYIRMAATSWTATQDAALAQRRLRELMDKDTTWLDVARMVEQVADAQDEELAADIRAMAEAVELPMDSAAAQQPADPQEGGSTLSQVLPFIVVGIGIAAVAVGGLLLYNRTEATKSVAEDERRPWGSIGDTIQEQDETKLPEEEEEKEESAPVTRGSEASLAETTMRPIEAASEAGAGAAFANSEGIAGLDEELGLEEDEQDLDYASGEGTVLGVYESEYHFGDDDFYHAFTLESAEGEFVGQCGVVISDVLGLDEAQQVDAFDIWLFEAQGTRTVSKVLASEYACQNESLNAKLSRKGELLEVEPGLVMTLETETLHLSAIVKDFDYRQDPQLERAIFSHLAVELTVEQLA